jgi:hypothetical protein
MSDHAVPFHCSTRVWGSPEDPTVEPTATQLRALTQETPCNVVEVAPAGVAALCRVHVDPDIRSTIGDWVPPGLDSP